MIKHLKIKEDLLTSCCGVKVAGGNLKEHTPAIIRYSYYLLNKF